MKKFFVCWAAQRQDGSVAAPVESFEEERPAIAQFHLRASQAANSGNIQDTVVLYTADGFQMDAFTCSNPPQAQEG